MHTWSDRNTIFIEQENEQIDRYEKIGAPNVSKNLELVNVWSKLEHPEYIFDGKVCSIPKFKYWNL